MKNSFASQLMLYMSAQNELSQKATDNVSEIKSGCSLDEMCVYIMLDQIKNQKSLYLICRGFYFFISLLALMKL